MYKLVDFNFVTDFNFEAISNAVLHAFNSGFLIFGAKKDTVGQPMDNMCHSLRSFTHSLYHWLLNVFHQIPEKIRSILGVDPFHSVQRAAVNVIRSKLLAIEFLKYSSKFRRISLFRSNDKSNTNSDDRGMNFKAVIAI